MTAPQGTAIRIPEPRPPMPDYHANMLERPVILFGSRHCTAPGCTRQDTVTADGVCGRRCDTHPPTFDPAHAVNLARDLGADAAMAYVRNSPDVAP